MSHSVHNAIAERNAQAVPDVVWCFQLCVKCNYVASGRFNIKGQLGTKRSIVNL
jgi:hypothetical protein